MGGWKAALTGRLESLPYVDAKHINLQEDFRASIRANSHARA
jgi:hypothetical protein